MRCTSRVNVGVNRLKIAERRSDLLDNKKFDYMPELAKGLDSVSVYVEPGGHMKKTVWQ